MASLFANAAAAAHAWHLDSRTRFFSGSVRFSGLFFVQQQIEASTQQAMTQAGRSCKQFGFFILWGAELLACCEAVKKGEKGEKVWVVCC